jgi:hypothetical protein
MKKKLAKTIYISTENMKNDQKISKDWLKKIKIYNIKKFNNIILIDEGSIGNKILI